ncbi:MAG: carbohydrate ABC transporter permease [Acholeplasmatales bacterium]|jgi:putative aldouronate transport system permease protein|nr:carbohydrate ABC transporter permease [Acholeplasmatales bacterium]
MKRLDRTEIIFKVLSYVLLTIFAIACVYPLVYVLAVSLSDNAGYGSNSVVLLPLISNGEGGIRVGIASWGKNKNAFTDIVLDKEFWFAYCNTIFYAFYGTLVSMIVGITGAYALSKTRLMFGRGFNFLLTFTMWFSAGIIATWQNFIKLGIDNKYGFILGLGFNAFNIILLRNGFKGVPTEIEEAATIDGATEFQLLTKIYIPMSKSSIATVTMFYALARWNGYYWASILLGNYVNKPLQVYMRDKLEEGNAEGAQSWETLHNYSQDSFMFAMIICSIIPIIIVYPMMQKYFAAGVNLGGVKE